MEVVLHPAMIAKEHITLSSNSHGEVKIFKYLDSLLTNKNSFHAQLKM